MAASLRLAASRVAAKAVITDASGWPVLAGGAGVAAPLIAGGAAGVGSRIEAGDMVGAGTDAEASAETAGAPLPTLVAAGGLMVVSAAVDGDASVEGMAKAANAWRMGAAIASAFTFEFVGAWIGDFELPPAFVCVAADAAAGAVSVAGIVGVAAFVVWGVGACPIAPGPTIAAA